MNAILNENQIWYCDVCDKTFSFSSKSKHFFSKTHKHKEKYGTVARRYELFKPEIEELHYILNDTVRGCQKEFEAFKHRCVYDIKFTKITNNEEFI